VLWEFGTNSVQLRERKKEWLSGSQATPDKALGFFDFVVGIQEVGGSKPLARPLSYPQSFTLLLPMPIFGQFSVHSVQLRATRTQTRTVLPTLCGSPRRL
jgi:hypothetical protein